MSHAAALDLARRRSPESTASDCVELSVNERDARNPTAGVSKRNGRLELANPDILALVAQPQHGPINHE